MRLASYRTPERLDEPPQAGLVIGDSVVDLVSAARSLQIPGATFERASAKGVTILHLLQSGEIEAARTFAAAIGQDRALVEKQLGRFMRPLEDCVLDAPVRPGKLITVARNYREHMKESGVTDVGPVPSASIKASSVVGGPYADIVRPQVEKKLDYETELVVVIGKRCKNVLPEHAYEVVAGYMVMNDVIARQVLITERKAGNQFLGKMFDSFAPTGPWLVTADEIPDPLNLAISTRVNGEIRQSGNTGDMIWSIPQLIAYFSQTTLEPGDIISTGTPAGVAAGRAAHETPWYLQPGDVVESEVEKIGLLRNLVVDAPAGPTGWKWV